MKISIKFSTDNAAFEELPEVEVRKILREIGEAVLLGITDGPCHDSNGNTIGQWGWK